MKVIITITAMIMSILCLVCVGSSRAQAEELARSSGFSGYLAMVSGMVFTTSNYYAFEGQKFALDNLDGELDDGINQGFFSIVGELRYRLKSGQQAYIGVPFDEENPRRFTSNEGISLGFVNPFSDYGKIDISLFVSGETVWKNPYLTGTNRTQADMFFYGIVVDYDGVWGSGINVLYKLKQRDMDKHDDVIGSLYPDLQRRGTIHTVDIEYDFLPHPRQMITPGITLEKGNINGKSNAFHSYLASLIYTWDRGAFIFNSSISAGREIYDKTHPLFDKTRKDTIYLMGIGMTLLGNLGFENVFVHCNINVEYRNSNIDFCDAKKSTAFIALGYNF